MSVILRLLGAELVLTVWGGCWARPCASNTGRVSWKMPASAAASTVFLKILRRLMTPIWLLRWFDITRYYPKIAESEHGRGTPAFQCPMIFRSVSYTHLRAHET